MNEEKALIEQNKLSYEDITQSIDTYYIHRENSTTINYFNYKNKKYPIMNIIKLAIEKHNNLNGKDIHTMGYNNLSACKTTLQNCLKNEIVFKTIIT